MKPLKADPVKKNPKYKETLRKCQWALTKELNRKNLKQSDRSNYQSLIKDIKEILQ